MVLSTPCVTKLLRPPRKRRWARAHPNHAPPNAIWRRALARTTPELALRCEVRDSWRRWLRRPSIIKMFSLEQCPANASAALTYLKAHAAGLGVVSRAGDREQLAKWERQALQLYADADTYRVTSFGCLDAATGRLPLPLRWGDPPARQVPLFIKWEDYIEYLPPKLSDVTFVQIGANCGKNTYFCAAGGDPLWSYVTSCGWRGVLVEPVSYVFLTLCKNYRRWAHRVTPLRGAVSDAPGTVTLTLGGGETNKMLLPPAAASKAGHTKAGKGGITRARANETGVPVTDLPGLWHYAQSVLAVPTESPATAEARPIDILVIDAEGAEPLILGVASSSGQGPSSSATSADATAAADGRPLEGRALPTPLPSLLLFEHAHLAHASVSAIHRHLMRHGYTHLADLRHQDPRGAHMRPANRLYGLESRRRAQAGN